MSLPLRGPHQPAEDHARHAAAKLLINNGLNQGFEVRLAELDADTRPTRSMISDRTGSDPRRWWMASFMLKQSCAREYVTPIVPGCEYFYL